MAQVAMVPSSPDTEGENRRKATEINQVSDKPRNVYERVVAVTQAVTVAASGKNAHGTKAMSIVDVESAISDAMAEHGLVTRWACRALSAVDQRTWQARVSVTVVNAENPEDCFSDEWEDTGGSAAAAYSFARKSYYKALFHLTDEGDDAKQTPAGTTPPPAATATTAAAPARPRPASAGLCPECEKAGYVTNTGKSPRFYESQRTGAMQCNGKDESGSYLNHVPLGNEDVDRGPVDPTEIPW